jgi:nucleotide-binding universal stress UspA family protein
MEPFPTIVLLATDGSEEARIASRMAASISQSTGSELHLVHVAGTGGSDSRVYEQVRQRAHNLLEEQAEKMRDAGATIAKKHLRNGQPDQEIVALAEELGAGLIVMGGRGRGGMTRALMGSVSDSVVRHASCPVLVARGSSTPIRSQ